MNHSPIVSKILALCGVFVGWLGVLVSHIDDINKALQFVALIFAIAASWAAYRFHRKNMPKK